MRSRADLKPEPIDAFRVSRQAVEVEVLDRGESPLYGIEIEKEALEDVRPSNVAEVLEDGHALQITDQDLCEDDDGFQREFPEKPWITECD